MSKFRSDHLFCLVKSMSSSEKRYFKNRNCDGGMSKLKFVKLFDAIDQLTSLEEEKDIIKYDWVQPTQLSNLKANLYKKILKVLKDFAAAKNHELTIRDQLDYVQLLFDRSLYAQSRQMLEKARKLAKASQNLEIQLEILKWEIHLLPFSIGRNNREKVNQIVQEADKINERISRINILTNLLVRLNSFYLQSGGIRNKKEFDKINETFYSHLPNWDGAALSFREKLLWYEIHVGFFTFVQDQERTYKYARMWVGLFPDPPGSSFLFEKYLKGLNYLLNSQSRLRLVQDFMSTHKLLRSLAGHRLISMNGNLQIRLFKYSYAHQFNKYFMLGDFKRGGILLRRIESRLEGYIGLIDKHSELVLFYKIACLHFGNGEYRKCLKWLNRIINSEYQDLREDVHAFARVIHLIIHYELGNRDFLAYAVRSTYRFLKTKGDLNLLQQHIITFIKTLSWTVTNDELMIRFKKLHEEIIPLTVSKFDNRPFVYFDMISWLESKIEGRPIDEVIKEKVSLPVLEV